ncbi:MAG TPA: metalloregulator ArsR/SmtB family transcription factor [Vicinamibacterales bacterium]
MPAGEHAHVTRYADMLGAMGTEPRLRIVRLLLAAHPTGMIAGEIGSELDIAPSTLSHHLERLRREEVVNVRRDGTFLWYTANAEALEDLLQFLFAECCTRCCAVDPTRLTAEVTRHKSQGTNRKIEESSS